jgi:hypothetical protein
MSLLELMRAELKASMALNKPHDDPDKWFEAVSLGMFALFKWKMTKNLVPSLTLGFT